MSRNCSSTNSAQGRHRAATQPIESGVVGVHRQMCTVHAATEPKLRDANPDGRIDRPKSRCRTNRGRTIKVGHLGGRMPTSHFGIGCMGCAACFAYSVPDAIDGRHGLFLRLGRGQGSAVTSASTHMHAKTARLPGAFRGSRRGIPRPEVA